MNFKIIEKGYDHDHALGKRFSFISYNYEGKNYEQSWLEPSGKSIQERVRRLVHDLSLGFNNGYSI